jgi:hypothetical protein
VSTRLRRSKPASPGGKVVDSAVAFSSPHRTMNQTTAESRPFAEIGSLRSEPGIEGITNHRRSGSALAFGQSIKLRASSAIEANLQNLRLTLA